jgi:DtxR family Mn-dependent transcriptional regulator
LEQQAIEDTLRTIYLLAQAESPVSTSRIADARRVKPSSVTQMLKRLNRQGLVNYTKHHGVTLTREGQTKALEMVRRHRLVELFLVNELDYGWHEVHDEADRLEHVISETLEDRLAAVLDQPEFDPHGQPIPSKEGVMAALESEPLVTMAEGRRARVAWVTNDANEELLSYLAELGITPGAEVVVEDTAPFEGPLTLKINHERKVVGRKAATAVHVTSNS